MGEKKQFCSYCRIHVAYDSSLILISVSDNERIAIIRYTEELGSKEPKLTKK